MTFNILYNIKQAKAIFFTTHSSLQSAILPNIFPTKPMSSYFPNILLILISLAAVCNQK